MNEAQIRRDLVRYSHAMHAAGWVANHDGNLSARLGPDRIICTPTAFGKLDVTREDLVLVNGDGKKIGGRRRPFSELVLHRMVYGNRCDAVAVVHAHPPYATAFGVTGRALPHPFLPEAVVSLGPSIPTIPLTAPGAPSADALRGQVRRCDAVLIAGNGVLTWGPSLELAYLRLELVEHLAKIAHHAHGLGGVGVQSVASTPHGRCFGEHSVGSSPTGGVCVCVRACVWCGVCVCVRVRVRARGA